MYEDVTFEDILERMLERVPDDMDKREGSIIYDALAPAAIELQLMYIELDVILKETFADTASREFLLRRAKERGIEPKGATHAVLRGIFTPDTLEIAEGTRFNCEELNYEVVGKNEDRGYNLRCETAGIAGNSIFGRLIPVYYIPGLEIATLTEVLIPGEEETDTEVLRKQYFDSFHSKAFGGNKKDYIEKTYSISGVGAVKVTPVWKGAGTVKLTILNAEYRKASTELLEHVQQEIDPLQDGKGGGLAPIGHTVTVDTPQEYPIEVTVQAVYDTGYSFEALHSQMQQAVENYFGQLREQWEAQEVQIIRVAQIEARLLAIDGIIDLSSVKLNGEVGNISLNKESIPVFGGIIS
ncbi:hypothetical protein C806_00118 [Lachnospiraceae bacterium 3-1]|nr:hypothetical protein C806_00118 [Lachnospiraceae bacterium 3-1]